MLSEQSFKEFSFISYFLFSHHSCNRCAIPDNDVNEYKIGLNIEYREEKKEDDENDMEVLDEDFDRTNEFEDENRPNNTK